MLSAGWFPLLGGPTQVYTDGDAAAMRLAQRNVHAETSERPHRCHFRRLRFGDKAAAKTLGRKWKLMLKKNRN